MRKVHLPSTVNQGQLSTAVWLMTTYGQMVRQKEMGQSIYAALFRSEPDCRLFIDYIRQCGTH